MRWLLAPAAMLLALVTTTAACQPELGGLYEPCWCEDDLQCLGLRDHDAPTETLLGKLCSVECVRNEDCPSPEGVESECSAGELCQLRCDVDTDCPEGMACIATSCWWPE